MNIKVFNLSLNIDDNSLERLFRRYGVVNSAVVDRNQYNGRSKGNAMVEMPVETEARQAIASLNHTTVDGKRISVSEYAATPEW